MRADIHDGREQMLQSEAGYIDARPHHQDRQNLLHRTAGPYIKREAPILELLSAPTSYGHAAAQDRDRCQRAAIGTRTPSAAKARLRPSATLFISVAAM
jgi:hypothetical protein